jgi:hypothetical protein
VIDIAELERRMRPGRWSEGGFLGNDERLEDVLAADARTLAELGLTREEIVEPLALLTTAPNTIITELYPELVRAARELPNWKSIEQSLKEARALVEQRFGVVEAVGSGVARVGRRYEVETRSYMGFQECPWSPQRHGDLCARDTTDWRIRDTTRGLELGGPGLIRHLIIEHGFFEGLESPYRVDPRALTELLQLGPFAPG